MENEIKKKRGGKLKRLEALKNHEIRAPKPMKEEKKRKEVQIRKWKKNQCKKAKSRSPETTKGLGSPRHIAQLRQD